ncbi:MAG: glycosyltransferase family protein [bacterium]|uniref:Glycosyltransferase family protein n=1 Tax=Candidatus Methylomirabilis tolerans TaxID=3123416 RepID=A0AAJ1AJB8_9BACT|nr:glycosyltransferase family protein [Candidatus Methylomirabilis sp.]
MNTVITVQARMTSTRLPGKVLKEVMGKSLLEYQVERLRRVKWADGIVIATTTNDTDLPIVNLCARLGIPVTRGSEYDVLARYYQAAVSHHASVVVRVTSDCPLIDPAVIDEAIRFYFDHRAEYDYVSNALTQSYPYGMAVEVFPFSVLDEAHRKAKAQFEREHVTPFIYTRPARYRIGHVVHAENHSYHRWTVDTSEDFELVRRILEALYPVKPGFDTRDILALLEHHPEWVEINAHVRQKRLGE